MLSLFIMYSNDRRKPLEMTISCLQEMEHYESCQKTLVVDGKLEIPVPGFEVIQVPRCEGKFNWSNMWDAGVATARHQTVLYLDSDRLLPTNYLERVLQETEDGVFVFTSRHFMLGQDMDLDRCRDFLSRSEEVIFSEGDFLGSMVYDPRYAKPFPGPGKNVMSGNTAFTRKTFLKIGGVDPWYCGHGAFADTDFHTQAGLAGCRFVDLKLPELHCYHTKQDDSDTRLDNQSLRRLGLDNFIYYCHKWGYPMMLAEDMALKGGIEDSYSYVHERLKRIIEDSPR